MFKFCLILLLFSSIKCQSTFDLENIPNFCNFFDTINITDGIRNLDETITFDGIRFTKNNYRNFTYMYLVNHEKVQVPVHIRGCICNYKNCVRLCCPLRHSYDSILVGNKTENKCVPNNNVAELDLKNLSNVAFVTQMPCSAGGYWLEPDEPLHYWRVLPNGSLILGEDKDPLIANRDEYCIAQVSDNNNSGLTTKVIHCISSVPQPEFVERLLYPAFMLVTVIFLMITLFVYAWIENLRTLHGKTFMCYLTSLIIGYSVLAFTYLANWNAYSYKYSCLILAEIIHTAFIAGFVWLSIIGYDIFRAVGRANQRSHQFLKYCLFASGTTFLIVLITNILDHVTLIDQRFQPGLGISACWLQDSKYAHFLYLYSIIIVIITINTVFFILTKRKIEWTQKLSRRATESHDSKKFACDETDADRYQLFIRLIIIMGLPWFLEIISWLTDTENIVIYIIDMVTMLIGPIIFFLSIKKPRVKRLMEEKLSNMTTWRTSLFKTGTNATRSSNSGTK